MYLEALKQQSFLRPAKPTISLAAGEADPRMAHQARLLTSELHLLQPLDRFALIGDNLRLPDERDGHEAHGNDTQNEDEADVGLLSGKPEYALKPCHGKGSPSTRSARSSKN